ncbi:MAG: PfkB family carbohydrate kinase, partial [Burkholderiaceae bacterium]
MPAHPPQYSLWLLPRADHEAPLVEHVARLSALVGGVRFEPHVTIHGDLALGLDDLVALARELASQVRQQHWPIKELQTGEHFFRCVYLRFDDHPAFAQLQSAVVARAGVQDGQSPFAHLSLAYGEPHPDNAKLCAVLAEEFAGKRIVFDRIAVVRSSKAVPIAEWSVLTTFPLSPNDTFEPATMSTLHIPEGRRHDLACLGRLAVDLYAQQLGARLEDVSSFAKYLGGSSANIAFGVARLGLRAAMVSRVGDEQMGR